MKLLPGGSVAGRGVVSYEAVQHDDVAGDAPTEGEVHLIRPRKSMDWSIEGLFRGVKKSGPVHRFTGAN